MAAGTADAGIDWSAVLVRRAVVVPFVILVVALGLRVVGLTTIHQPYWDEVTYVGDAEAYLGRAPARVRPLHPVPEIAESSWMHPPLGKWSIAVGLLTFGSSVVGDRAAAVVAGTIGVLLLYLLALELWGSVAMAATAAVLLSVDGLHVVQSRIAMLDVFLSTFLLAGALCLVRARRGRTALAWVGLWLGAACAVKWAAVPYLLVAAFAAWWWLRPAIDRLVVAFVVVPAAAYLVAYTGFFVEHGPDLIGFVRLQLSMLRYGQRFQDVSPYRSSPWGWPLLRGTAEYAHGRFLPGGVRIVAGQVRIVRVLPMGNPATWWAFLVAGPSVAVRAIRERRWQDALVVAGYLAGWAPWLVVSRTRFSYYLLPSVPFLCLGVVAALWMLAPKVRRVVAPALVGTASVLTLLYLPVLIGTPMSMSTYLRLSHLPGVRGSVHEGNVIGG